MKKFVRISSIVVIAMFIISFVVINTLHIVHPGYRAAVETYGYVHQESYRNGIVTTVPGSKVVMFDIREQKHSFKMDVKTSSMQNVKISGALNYNLVPDNVYRLYENVGEDYKPVIITPLLEGALNEVVGKQSAEFLVNSQELVREAIVYIVKDQLDQTQLVNVNDFRMFRPVFDPAFEKAISDKAVAMQIAEKAKIETLRIEEEALQMKKKLEAEAYGINLTSKALNNPLIVKYEYAKAMGKWTGKLPSTLVVGQNGSIPVLPLDK
jgi:regulator of protease activity HflC (stomatin/prohibitin superfamily)